MPGITDIVFDIDNTLLVIANNFIPGDHKENLSVVKIDLCGVIASYWIINLEPMKLIFQNLLKKNIKINFITAGLYTKKYVTTAFEKLYDLPKDSLLNCVLINRQDFPEVSAIEIYDRGKVALAAQDAGWFAADAKLLFVDDCPFNKKALEKRGFNVIAACGYPRLVYDFAGNLINPVVRNNLYLCKIVDACHLNVILYADVYETQHDEELINSEIAKDGIQQISEFSMQINLVTTLRHNHRVKLCSDLSDRIISSALESCKHPANKILLERHAGRLKNILLDCFFRDWHKFNDIPDTELKPFYDDLISFIYASLKPTDWKKRWGNWSYAGLYLSNSAMINADIPDKFRAYQPSISSVPHPHPRPQLQN